MTFTVCSPQTMPKYDYNTVEDNNLQTSVQLKSGRCLKLSDKIDRNMPNFLSISLTINKKQCANHVTCGVCCLLAEIQGHNGG